jgi:hypothetical protein
MTQRYEIWRPINNESPEVSVEALHDDWEGFRVLLREHGSERVIRVAFNAHVAYQNRDESDLHGEALRSEGLMRGCFYLVRDSEFAQRFAADSLRDCSRLKHFAIITDTDCIDVLAPEDPQVQRL